MLTVVIGPMFAGKTEHIISIARRYRVIDKKVLFINHIKDNRYGKNHVISHNGDKELCLSVDSLNKIVSHTDYQLADVVIIEEAQFFPDLYEFITRETDQNLNKNYIVSGLAGCYKKNKIGQILDIIPHAEIVEKLNGYCVECKDGTTGSFTKLINNCDMDSQIHIGGKETYICVCRKHYTP